MGVAYEQAARSLARTPLFVARRSRQDGRIFLPLVAACLSEAWKKLDSTDLAKERACKVGRGGLVGLLSVRLTSASARIPWEEGGGFQGERDG